MNDQETTSLLLSKAPEWSSAEITTVDPVAGDASGRQYSRIHFENAPQKTLILMKTQKVVGPLSSAGERFTQDHGFINVGQYLAANGLPVPKIISFTDDYSTLLVEDVGPVALWHFTFGKLTPEGEQIKNSLGEDATVTLYKKAVDLLPFLQGAPRDEECIAFQREMGFNQLKEESLRFIKFYLLPNGFPEEQVSLLDKTIDTICTAVSNHPQKLMHRDYMPWNLHISAEGDVQIIDFQDCCLGSSVYDIVSLIHDRDADFALGQEAVREIVLHYQKVMNEEEDFTRRYYEVILQRYFRLAGQFGMLTEKTGNPIYKSWVPGCFKRLGSTLVQMDDMQEVLEILSKAVPEVKEGAGEPLVIS